MTNKVTKAVAEADAKWGSFRKWLSANPLTGFWSGASGALMLGFIIGLIVG